MHTAFDTHTEWTGLNPWGGSIKSNNVDVTQCGYGSFCCGVGMNGSTCCTEAKGVWMKDGKETKVSPNTTSSATTSPSATSAAPAAQSPTKPVTVSHGPNAGAIAGGVVSGLVALVLLLGLMYWAMRRRRSGVASKSGGTKCRSGHGQRKRCSERATICRPTVRSG